MPTNDEKLVDLADLKVAYDDLESKINNKVAKTGDTMTGPLTIDMTTPRTVDDADPEYAEIARFKRSAMHVNDNVMLYLGKDFSDKNCGTILYHHAGNGSDSNYLALSAYNAAQSLRSYTDGHIELTQPLGVPYGGTGGNAMVYKGQKTASDSLDSINESGYWDCQINNLPSGIPSDAPNMNAIVINYYMPNIATNYQIYTVFQGGVSLRYERRFLGTWSSWRKVQYAT